MKTIDYVSDDVPVWAISYLVNGDASGLDYGDADMVDDWKSGITECLRALYPGCFVDFLMDDDAEPSFSPHPAFGLAADCVPAVLAVMADDEHPAAAIALPWEDDEESPDAEDEESPDEKIRVLYDGIMQSEVFRTDGYPIDLPCMLRELGNAVHSAETDESIWSLGESSEACLGDLIVGAYWALTEWHGGQSSDSYAAMCAPGQVFSPGMTDGPEPDSGESAAYEMVSKWFEEHPHA